MGLICHYIGSLGFFKPSQNKGSFQRKGIQLIGLTSFSRSHSAGFFETRLMCLLGGVGMWVWRGNAGAERKIWLENGRHLILLNILLLNDDSMMPFTGNKGNATNIYLVANLNLVEKGDQQLLGSEIPASFKFCLACSVSKSQYPTTSLINHGLEMPKSCLDL